MGNRHDIWYCDEHDNKDHYLDTCPACQARRIRELEAGIEEQHDEITGLRAVHDLYGDLYGELKGCKWIREDGGENKLAVTMANLKRWHEAEGGA